MRIYGIFGRYPCGLRITLFNRPWHVVRKAFGIGWRTGFIGVMLTEADS